MRTEPQAAMDSNRVRQVLEALGNGAYPSYETKWTSTLDLRGSTRERAGVSYAGPLLLRITPEGDITRIECEHCIVGDSEYSFTVTLQGNGLATNLCWTHVNYKGDADLTEYAPRHYTNGEAREMVLISAKNCLREWRRAHPQEIARAQRLGDLHRQIEEASRARRDVGPRAATARLTLLLAQAEALLGV